MGLFDDILSAPPGNSGGNNSTPSKPGLFDDILANNSPANNQSIKPTLNSPNEFVDAFSSLGSGLARGYAAAPGILGDLQQLSRKLPGAPKRSMLDAILEKTTGYKDLPTSEDTIAAAGKFVPAVNEKPQTQVGAYAEKFGEFLPGAMTGDPLAGSIVKNAVIPSVVAKTVQDQVDKGNVKGWVAPVATVASSILAHGAHRLATPTTAAREEITKAFNGITESQLNDAEQLMADARSKGINLTRAEAVQQVTGGFTNAGNLQRVVEGQGGLQDFMGKRPEQIRQANEQMLSSIAETPSNPSSIGPQVGQAADSIVSDTTKSINARTAPRYKAAEADIVPAADMAALGKDKIFSDTLKEVRSDPTLNKTIAHLPDNSSVVLDLVQRRMGEVADNAMMPGQATTSNTRAGNIGTSRGEVRAVADAASSELAGARATQQVLRDLHLKPLMEGPVGKLAGKDTTTKAAVDALFPSNPLPNSAQEITNTVGALSSKNPWAARQVVRSHVESVFNQATKDLQSGANEFGGAGLRAKLIGNKQQAANLAASIKALPGGDNILQGFDKMMEIMGATGQRQRIGSQTAFNQEALSILKSGNTLTEAIATGGVKLPQKIKDKLQEWNLGKNVDEVARLLTEPDAADAFKKLATSKGGSDTIGAMGRLLAISSRSTRSTNNRGQEKR